MTWLSWIISNMLLASLLALAAFVVQRRLQLPAVARILWMLVLVKLVTPPLVNVPLVDLPSSMACAMGVCHCEHAGTRLLVLSSVFWGLLAVWTAGAATTAWNAWRRWIHFQRLTAHASPAPAEWQALAARLAGELSIRRPPQILSVPGRLPPLVVSGWRQSRMLLPNALLGRLSESQREALLLHELSHIKRGDHLVRMLELAVRIAYWWLPAVRSIGRQLRACEETCCDAMVVAHLPQARHDYARLLLDVVEFATPLPTPAMPQATAMGIAGDLEQRMRGILHAAPIAKRPRLAATLAIGAACAIMPLQLHYDFTASYSTPSMKPGCPPMPKATNMPLDDRCAPFTSFVCPS
jgi:bla regulator protein blaR1